MSLKLYIKRAIESFVDDNSVMWTDYQNWYVGVTNNTSRREREHSYPNIWRSWKANSVREARDIETLFLDEGMQGASGGGRNPVHVYVYKESGPNS